MSAPNIALIVLDSLRYDVAQMALAGGETPNLERTLKEAGAGVWRKAYAQGTCTLPACISMLHAGFLPDDCASEEPIYNRRVQGAFRGNIHLHGDRNVLYSVSHATSMVRGFAEDGYFTLGIGGVGWFDLRFKTAHLWHQYFDLFHWDPVFHESNPASLEAQIDWLSPVSIPEPTFIFWNIASTHRPDRVPDHKPTLDLQIGALAYVDYHLPAILSLLPKPCHVFLCADHGDCFGEDGQWGHGFYHPKVMEVPLVHFMIGGES